MNERVVLFPLQIFCTNKLKDARVFCSTFQSPRPLGCPFVPLCYPGCHRARRYFQPKDPFLTG